MTTLDVTAPATRLKGWDSLEFYVGNARAMAGFLTAAFGFEVTAYAGPETGRDDIASYLLRAGRHPFRRHRRPHPRLADLDPRPRAR